MLIERLAHFFPLFDAEICRTDDSSQSKRDLLTRISIKTLQHPNQLAKDNVIYEARILVGAESRQKI